MSNMTYITDAWMITCIVPRGTDQADKMLIAARDAGVTGGIGYHARGFGQRERFGVLGIAVEAEKDVRVVLVSSEQRDVVFEAMYKAGGLDRPGAGVMFLTPVDRVATYIPDSVVDRLKEAGRWNPAS